MTDGDPSRNARRDRDLAPSVWAGVDVGGRRKGFHVALIGRRRLLHLERASSAATAAALLRAHRPVLVAVDGPRRAAATGRARDDEIAFARAGICHIRFTPTARVVRSNPHFEWVCHGLELYELIDRDGLRAIECFPTASWTVWGGRRSGNRAGWSDRVLRRMGLGSVPDRLGQDFRDAIGAALTAREHDQGRTRAYGEIVVPSVPLHY